MTLLVVLVLGVVLLKKHLDLRDKHERMSSKYWALLLDRFGEDYEAIQKKDAEIEAFVAVLEEGGYV